MVKYLCLTSFAGVDFSGQEGCEIDLKDKAVIASLLKAGYIRATEGATAVEEPAAAPAKKKTPAKRKTAKKG